MANIIIKPTFSSEADRLTFLSRLWGITITASDVLDWEAYKLTRPVKLIAESDEEFYQRRVQWDEGRVARRAFFVLSKWDSYGLGSIKRDNVVTLLNGRSTVNRTIARQAVDLQVNGKYAWNVATFGIDVANSLLPLVQGLEW